MQIIVLTNESLKVELLSNNEPTEEIIWIEDPLQIAAYTNADIFIDLLFEKDHIAKLEELLPNLVIINSVEESLLETNTSFVRINAWPGFLRSGIIEASSANADNKKKTEEVFSLFHKKLEWLPDEVGFITPRVISMIINEAYISLSEDVSTKEEINTAMKLGTNYPYGPFEWAEKIGFKKISSLLTHLSQSNPRYTPSSLLLQQEPV